MSKATLREMIAAYRTEAGQAGDMEMVAICDRALGGDEDAIAAVQDCIVLDDDGEVLEW